MINYRHLFGFVYSHQNKHKRLLSRGVLWHGDLVIQQDRHVTIVPRNDGDLLSHTPEIVIDPRVGHEDDEKDDSEDDGISDNEGDERDDNEGEENGFLPRLPRYYLSSQ